MARQPSFGLAEIAWRWSFGAVFWLTLAFSAAEYLKSLPVSSRELLLLRTRQPVLVADAIARIFRGSAARGIEGIGLLATLLAIGWTVLSALARAALIKSLRENFRADSSSPTEERCRTPWHSLFGLSFFRVAVTLTAVIGFVGTFFLASAVSPAGDPAPGSATLVFLSLILFVWLAWSMLNWLLSFAAVFVVVEGQHTFQAIASVVGLCCRRTGPVLAVGTWFGLAHVVAFVLATAVVAFPLGFAGIFPAGIVLGGVLLITLLYFAAADFLYVGRLAAYVAILEIPETSGVLDALPTNMPGIDQSGVIDQNELILSDVPAQA